MERYSWPGNVRELRNVVERAVYRWDTPEPVADITFDPFESRGSRRIPARADNDAPPAVVMAGDLPGCVTARGGGCA
jgi:psp operon transcriptional activator